MDFKDVFNDLADRYPQWIDRIHLLRLKDVVGVHPVENDGQIIYYNSRLLQYLTHDTQLFYAAQQLVHIQLNHYARGAGRDPRVWKRATDGVVNAMLQADGFVLPEDAGSRNKLVLAHLMILHPLNGQKTTLPTPRSLVPGTGPQ